MSATTYRITRERRRKCRDLEPLGLHAISGEVLGRHLTKYSKIAFVPRCLNGIDQKTEVLHVAVTSAFRPLYFEG
jgi:hypothetical protein